MKKLLKTFIPIILTLLLLNSCGSNRHGETTPPSGDIDLPGAYVHQTNSPYKDVLVKCIQLKNDNSCPLSTLPFIAQDNDLVTKEMIMQRLVVSDAWMAERFSQLLDTYQDKNILKLFGAVTAIVIHKEIIPSFYTSQTGAIYLDPRYLWLTPQEASTIIQKEDHRSNYGKKLQFIAGSLYTKDSISIHSAKKLNSGQSRTLNEIAPEFASLLYHELAHANDIVPPVAIKTLDKNQTVLNVTNALSSHSISAQLYNQSPLTSDILMSLGKVLYHGHLPTEEEQTYSGYQVGLLFDEDRASNIYAYSTMYEDTATLFADTMMKIHYGANSNVLFLNADAYNNEDKLVIEWGISNPIAKASVKPRALFVANRLNPVNGGWDKRFSRRVGSFGYISKSKNSKLINHKTIHIDDIKAFKNFQNHLQY